MTLSTGLTQPLPDQMSLHESPNASSADLADLGLPQPAFRRRSNNSSPLSSNRSSMHSLHGLTSEEIWKMDQEANQPDLSNPNRPARERPLDTVRRLSRTFEQPNINQLPGEIICKSPHSSFLPFLSCLLTLNRAIRNRKWITCPQQCRSPIKIIYEYLQNHPIQEIDNPKTLVPQSIIRYTPERRCISTQSKQLIKARIHDHHLICSFLHHLSEFAGFFTTQDGWESASFCLLLEGFLVKSSP
jgi:hypothetical protein